MSTQFPTASMNSARAPPRRTDHTYRDFSKFAVDKLLPPNKKAQTNFPAKLHQILSTPEFSHPHGRAWKIHNKELFISEVTPKFFAQSKYESFTRQLNGWGFKRLQQPGNDFNAYYHECFLRGLPHLTAMMKRVSPNQGKLLPHVEGEPNFYEIDKRFPTVPYDDALSGSFSMPSGVWSPWEPPLGYHTGPSQLSSSSEVYGPPPPFYGHHGHLHAVAACNPQIGSYPPYPPQYQMQYGHQPYEQYPYHSYSPWSPHSTSPQRDNAPPSGANAAKSGEVSSNAYDEPDSAASVGWG
ncbi:hypothetical protein ACHAW5_009116 [Stephanodiscus triporus]|uniref:HSF-type DNA-binding domain-containing protein n=1 Tax=Stephanodiscus triporus TaxID=2934178 RepID=A0ABD3P9H5_9STRA